MIDEQTVTSEAAGSEQFFRTLVESPDGDAFLACMQCGTCSGSCPLGYAMEYPPRRIILEARYGSLDRLVSSPSVWMCVGCYTCSLRCPREIELADLLWPALRDRAMQLGKDLPSELQDTFQSIYKYGNSLGKSPRQRMAWAEGLDVPVRDLSKDPAPVDVLWLVGDYPSYYPRNQAVARGFARILHALGVNFGVLGRDEKALGECDGLVGEQGLFETLVEGNKEALAKQRFKKIVMLDPHGYRAFQKYYPRFGVKYPAEHYTTFLADRLGTLAPLLKKPVEATITYHDNCCVGRRYHCFEEPRALLSAIPGVKLVEMARNRENSLCCGGGSGGMWLDAHVTAHGGKRLSDERVAMAAESGAAVLAVSCPYELSRFEDSAKVAGLEGRLAVRDVIELLAQSMDLGQ